MTEQLTVTALQAECLKFVQDQSSGEWGEELEALDAAKLAEFVQAHRIKALEQAAGVADAEEASRVAMFNQNSASINAHRATAAYEIATAIRALKDTSYD